MESPDQRASLLRLCHNLMPDDASLADEVALARQNPEAYRAQFHDRLINRGIDEDYETDEGAYDPIDSEPVPDLPWIALLDGLMERGRLVELDWKTPPQEVMQYVDQMLPSRIRTPDHWAWVDLEQWNRADTSSFVRAIGDWLHPQGVVLAELDLDSDSIPLVVLDQHQVATIRELADHAGYGWIRPVDEA